MVTRGRFVPPKMVLILHDFLDRSFFRWPVGFLPISKPSGHKRSAEVT
jgi:hypothetical protein